MTLPKWTNKSRTVAVVLALATLYLAIELDRKRQFSDYYEVGRKMLNSQKKGEPIDSGSLGFRFGRVGTQSIEASKRFKLFKGMAIPKPSEFSLGEHKIAITDAWLEQGAKDHIQVKEPESYFLSFILKMDGRRPQEADSKIVCCTQVKSKNGFDEKYDDIGESESSESPFHLKIPTRNLTSTLPIRMFLGDMQKGTNRLEPNQPSQIVTFQLPTR